MFLLGIYCYRMVNILPLTLMREEIIKMDIFIAYGFLTFSIFMLTWGLIKIVEKVAEINYHIDHIKKRLDEYDEKAKRVTAETK